MKILKNKKVLVFSILVIVVGVYVNFNGKTKIEETPVPPTISNPEDLISLNQEVYSFRVEGFNKAKKVEWGLEGESANIVDDKVNIKKLKAVYYGQDVTFNLTADKAIYNKTTQDIELEENIIGTASDGGTLMTDYAKWNSKTQDITTDSYVTVTRENIICKGRGLLTKPELKWVSFKEEIDVDFGEAKKITCDGPFEIDHKKSIATFNKNVKVVDKESVMYTDKLTVYLDPETNAVEHVVTEGNVKVVHRGDLDNIGNFGKVSF